MPLGEESALQQQEPNLGRVKGAAVYGWRTGKRINPYFTWNNGRLYGVRFPVTVGRVQSFWVGGGCL